MNVIKLGLLLTEKLGSINVSDHIPGTLYHDKYLIWLQHWFQSQRLGLWRLQQKCQACLAVSTRICKKEGAWWLFFFFFSPLLSPFLMTNGAGWPCATIDSLNYLMVALGVRGVEDTICSPWETRGTTGWLGRDTVSISDWNPFRSPWHMVSIKRYSRNYTEQKYKRNM